MPNWDWWDAWKSGDADKSQRALDEETDRSLARDPGRWSWLRTSEQIEEDQRRERERGHRGGHTADRRHHGGKGTVRGGESGERTSWRDSEWRKAQEDYERQNRPDRHDDRDRDSRDDDRGIFW